MPVDTITVVTVLAVALAANLVVTVVLVWSLLAPRRHSSDRLAAGRGGRAPASDARQTANRIDLDAFLGEAGIAVAADRVVRLVSWALILSIAVIVAVTGLWRDHEQAIFVLIALAGVSVLVVHDLLPTRRFGAIRFVAEGTMAIVVVSALVVLTGGAASPFFFLYALVVAGEALVASSSATLLLVLIAGLGYVGAVALNPLASAPTNPQIAGIGINLAALCLLAYAAMVVAAEQRRQRDAAVRLSTIDSLTELHNRAYFFNVLEREIQRSARFGRGFCLLMMDLDGLKTTNDRFGHFLGDRVLRGAAAVIKSGLRGVDSAARYGGDEFVVLLPETDPTGAYVVAEKIRQGVADLIVDAGGSEVRTSLSIGVVAYPQDGSTADELMIAADRAMYGSKRLGKNQVVGFAEPDGDGAMQRWHAERSREVPGRLGGRATAQPASQVRVAYADDREREDRPH